MTKNIIIMVVVSIVAFAVGFVVPRPETKGLVNTQELPLIPEILLNPVYYEWWASAEGTLVQKTDSSITLERNGKQAVIVIKDDFTRFFIQEAETGQITPTSFDKIIIGSELRGGVLMSKKNTPGIVGKENVAVGNSFTIIFEPPL